MTDFQTLPSDLGDPEKSQFPVLSSASTQSHDKIESRKRSKKIDISQMTINELAKIDAKRALDELNVKYYAKKRECLQLNSVIQIVSLFLSQINFVEKFNDYRARIQNQEAQNKGCAKSKNWGGGDQ